VELAKPYEHTACSAEMEIGPIDFVKRALKFYAPRLKLPAHPARGGTGHLPVIWTPRLCRKIFWLGGMMPVNQA
jgi:hypothetical protein